MNAPNLLGFSRVALTFVIMLLLFVETWWAKPLALGLFVVAAITDWLDGWLARRWRQTTPMGALLDPIADKILVLGMFLVFVQLELVPAWMVLLIMFREVLITSVRLYAVSRGVVLAAAREGKHKTASQMFTITLILTLLAVQACLPETRAQAFVAPVQIIILICVWVTMLLTIISGAAFFWRNRNLFQG